MALRALKLKERNCLIRDFYLKNRDKGKAFTVHHFRDNHGLNDRTTYRCLMRVEDDAADENMERREVSGRPRALGQRQTQAILRAMENKKGASTSKQASQYGVTTQTIRNTMRREGVNAKKRQRSPKISPDQHIKIQERCQILARDYFPIDGRNHVIIDDESYFLLKDDHVAGNRCVWTRDIEKCPPEVRYIQTEKYPKKLLVHATISQRGISKLFFVPAGNAVNAEVYMDILRTRVIPFIREKHADRRYFFWMDLASAHFANRTLEYLREQNIKFVPKSANPPAVPSLRPIEDFWSALKREVYAGGWEASNFEELKRRISAKAHQMSLEVVWNLFRTLRERIHTCAEKGYWAVHR